LQLRRCITTRTPLIYALPLLLLLPQFVIGRNPAAWASIPDAEVSGRHASLTWSDNANCWQLVG
jgi:hypothetical protein